MRNIFLIILFVFFIPAQLVMASAEREINIYKFTESTITGHNLKKKTLLLWALPLITLIGGFFILGKRLVFHLKQ